MLPFPVGIVGAIAGALLVAALAWRASALRPSGAWAAAVVGAVSLGAGFAWGAYLITWFASASLLSRVGRELKTERLAGVIEKDGARSAVQVLANGAVYTVCAALSLAAFHTSWWRVPGSDAVWAIAGAAALAAAGADTWATEIGTWRQAHAWAIRSGRRVPAGTSGAITVAGTIALALGALTYGLAAGAVGLVPRAAWWVIALAGIAGAMADTVLGAWWQERRFCERCAEPTEQRVHRCGEKTRQAGGRRGFQNDVVNLSATLFAAVLAALLAVQVGSIPVA